MSKSLSVVVLAYNHSKFIHECLNSLMWQNDTITQTIIVDDCSVDDTKTQIDSWINNNKNRVAFDIVFIRNQENEGTVASILKALSKNTSEIVKLIGGDDFLVPDAMKNIQSYFHEHCVDVLSTRVIPFADTASGSRFIYDYGVSFREMKRGFFDLSASEQFKKLCMRNRIDAPGTAFRRGIIEHLNLLQGKVRLVEDWPLWLIITNRGIRVNFLNEVSVFYRRHTNQLTSSVNQSSSRSNYTRDHVKIYEHFILPYLKEFRTLERSFILDKYAYYKWKAGLQDASENRFSFAFRHPAIAFMKLAGLPRKIFPFRIGASFDVSEQELKLAIDIFLK